MEAAVTTEPSKQSWRRLALVLAAFILLPLEKTQLQLLIPIVQTSLLLVPIIAVCAIVGWLGGGKPYIAVAWGILAIWLLVVPFGRSSSPYEGMARGWALLLAGSFGLMSLWSSATPFLVRALGALGLAMGAAFVLAISSPGGIERYEKVSASEFSGRASAVIAILQTGGQSRLFRAYASKVPEMDDVLEDAQARARAMPPISAVLLPALIALESLASLAIGWAVYSRLTPQRIGPALGPLREFRFNDQLVWGVAVGATMLLLPPFEEGKNAGLNLLVFFGALYLLRGLGVMAWMTKGKSRILVSALVTTFVLGVVKPAVGAVLFAGLLQLTLLVALGLGLGDTWLDWRTRPTAG